MNRRPQIEERVASLMRQHGAESLPIDVRRIAIMEGLEIVSVDMEADVSGALIRTHGHAAIAVNSSHSASRQRFTIAHELGHHALRHKDEDHIDWHFTVLRRDATSSEAVNDDEIEANFFAASLLMPKSQVFADAKELVGFRGELLDDDNQIAVLAKKYAVSPSAMRYRLINLGLLKPY